MSIEIPKIQSELAEFSALTLEDAIRIFDVARDANATFEELCQMLVSSVIENTKDAIETAKVEDSRDDHSPAERLAFAEAMNAHVTTIAACAVSLRAIYQALEDYLREQVPIIQVN